MVSYRRCARQSAPPWRFSMKRSGACAYPRRPTWGPPYRSHHHRLPEADPGSGLSIDLELTMDTVNLGKEKFDLAIRGTISVAPNLITRQPGQSPVILAASLSPSCRPARFAGRLSALPVKKRAEPVPSQATLTSPGNAKTRMTAKHGMGHNRKETLKWLAGMPSFSQNAVLTPNDLHSSLRRLQGDREVGRPPRHLHCALLR